MPSSVFKKKLKSEYHHHNHIVPLTWISLTLSHHFSLSFIASVRSPGLHPVSSQRCCTYVRAGRLAFARPYGGVHRSTSLMSSSQLLQQCPACLVRLTWIVFVMGGNIYIYIYIYIYSCMVTYPPSRKPSKADNNFKKTFI